MTIDGGRLHLIERAAARLEPTAAWTAAAPTATRVADNVGPLPTKERSIAIDRAALERGGMIDGGEPGARVAEEFRIVQAEILRRSGGANQSDPAPRCKLVMITSALPREGKSFTALNVAVGIARNDERRVLLVDADGRAGSLGDRFGLAAAPGLLDLAADRTRDPAGLIVASAIANLGFLPHGSGAKAAPEGLGESSTAGVIEMLATRYPDRLILIDAPACLSSSRPHLFAPLVGQVVLVVAAGSTQESDVEAALGLVRSCAGVSLLLNKVRRWHAHSFGSYANAS